MSIFWQKHSTVYLKCTDYFFACWCQLPSIVLSITQWIQHQLIIHQQLDSLDRIPWQDAFVHANYLGFSLRWRWSLYGCRYVAVILSFFFGKIAMLFVEILISCLLICSLPKCLCLGNLFNLLLRCLKANGFFVVFIDSIERSCVCFPLQWIVFCFNEHWSFPGTSKWNDRRETHSSKVHCLSTWNSIYDQQWLFSLKNKTRTGKLIILGSL